MDTSRHTLKYDVEFHNEDTSDETPDLEFHAIARRVKKSDMQAQQQAIGEVLNKVNES